MLIGVPKEIKNHEYRVGLSPASVRELVAQGHQVLIETEAGAAIGLNNRQYQMAGAELVEQAEEIFSRAELIVKIKEPQAHECRWLRPDQAIFTYLHLAPDPQQTELLLASGTTAIAYETVTNSTGGLPLLAPMSEVAGRMSIQAGATYLETANGGSGILLGGVPGVQPAHVVILGGGVVGYNAALIAVGMGAQVTVLDRSLERLRFLDTLFANRIRTLYSNAESIESQILDADLVIGAILVPGASTDCLVDRGLLGGMRHGSVLVDVAIDQGGCFASSRPTTHAEPTYIVDGIVHYCVANMPGAVARTSTFALNNATLPFVLALANKGWRQALLDDVHLRNGLNIIDGAITCAPVATSQGHAFVEALEKLEQR